MESEIPQNAPKACPGTSSLSAGKATGCSGCPNQSQCAGGASLLAGIHTKINERLNRVKNIIMIVSGKGGVGKSSVTACIAYGLSTFVPNCSVGVLDIDLTGPSMPVMMGCCGIEVHSSASGWSPVYVTGNLAVMSIGFMLDSPDQPIVWRDPKKNNMITKMLTDVNWCDEDEEDIDYLIIDTPPGTSGEHMSIVSLLKECGVLDRVTGIFVSSPQNVVVDDVQKQLGFFRALGVSIKGIIENMSNYQCRTCNHEFEVFPGGGAVLKLCEEHNLTLISKLPLDAGVGYRLDNGMNVFDEDNEDEIDPNDKEKVFGPKPATLTALESIIEWILKYIPIEQCKKE